MSDIEKILYKHPEGDFKITRTAIINYLIQKYNYSSYLEIGVKGGKNFNAINIKNKESVDPSVYVKNFKPTYVMTSDDFFNQIKTEKKYDIIFIDGLHLKEQVAKDVENSLKHLNENGTIVMHDCSPPTEKHQMIPRVDKKTGWTGDTWKHYVKMRTTRDDLKMLVVNTDYGVGIVQKGSQYIYETEEDVYNYKYLDIYRKSLLNLIEPEQLKDYLC